MPILVGLIIHSRVHVQHDKRTSVKPTPLLRIFSQCERRFGTPVSSIAGKTNVALAHAHHGTQKERDRFSPTDT